MSESTTPRTLTPDVLAAYLDRRVTPAERAEIEAAIAADPEKYEWLVFAMDAVDHLPADLIDEPSPVAPPVPSPSPGPSPLPFRPSRRGMTWVVAVGTLAAMLALAVPVQPTWWRALWGPSVEQELAALVAASGGERFFEPRLTGGFPYGPVRPVMRDSRRDDARSVALLTAASNVQAATAGDQSAPSRHAAGVAALVAGGSELTAAVPALEAAAAADGRARYYADLGAAYLERGIRTGTSDDMTRALQATEEALQREPTLLEALYNRALTLEKLQDRQRAVDAWRSFLQSAPRDAWYDDATRHLAALETAR